VFIIHNSLKFNAIKNTQKSGVPKQENENGTIINLELRHIIVKRAAGEF